MCNFLWGGGEGVRKIAWVKWEELCLQLKYGGLGLKNFEWFNYALIGKWLWRYLVESESLWARVVRARHGDLIWDEEGFKLEGNRARQGGWWKSVLGLSRGVVGKSIRDHLILSLGEGDKLLFWHHFWVGACSLKVAFPRLYRLSSNQGGFVNTMGYWDNGEWVWDLRWSRPLLDREIEVVDSLMAVLNGVSLKAGTADAWRWNAAPDGCYSTNSAYYSFSSNSQERSNTQGDKVLATLWKAPAPFKSIVTTWRVLNGKMATCENLIKRNVVIPTEEARCVACKDQAETADHVFFSCEESRAVWQDVLKWLGFQSVLPEDAKAHFLMFFNLGRKTDKRLLSGVWIAVVWCIWKWRNDCKFNNVTWDRGKMFAEIKSRLWSWKMAYNISAPSVSFRRWFSTVDLLCDPE